MTAEIFSGQGFDLLKIELFRFMNYHTPIKFNFNQPYIVLSGPTGSGKTTVLDALTFALFGRSSRLDLGSVKIEDICDKNGRVICEFMAGENHIRVIRGRDTKGKSYLNLFIDGKRYTGKIPDLNEKIRSSILGMNYQAFVNSTIIRQDEMKALGSKSSTERLRVLQNLFRLDIFEKAASEVQDQLILINNRKIKTETEIEGKEAEFLKLEKLEEEKITIETKLHSSKKKYEILTKSIQKMTEDEKQKALVNEKYQILINKIEETNKRLEIDREEAKNAEVDLDEYKRVQEQLNHLEKQVQQFEIITRDIQALESAKKEFLLLNETLEITQNTKGDQISTLKQDVSDKKLKLDHQLKKIIESEKNTVDHESAFKILNQEGRLLERVQRISKEKTWNLGEIILKELKEEQKTARKDLKEIQADKKKISKESFVLSEIKQNSIELKEEIIELENRLEGRKSQFNAELEKIQKKLSDVPYDSKKEEKLLKLKEEYDSSNEIPNKYKKILDDYKKLSDPAGKVTLLHNQITRLQQELKNYTDELKGYPTFKKQYENLKERLEIETKEKENLVRDIAQFEEGIKFISKQITSISSLEPEIIKLKGELFEVNKEYELLDKLKNDVFHTKGAPFFAINKILPRLGKRASLILSELTDQRYNSLQLQKVEMGRRGTGFEILIKVPEGFRDVATFSGGERTQINAALRLAISEEITELNRYNKKPVIIKKTLFIDEGDLGSLDTIQAQQAFVKKLFKLTERFKIILITHLTEVANTFPHSINITRDQYGRSIKG